MLIHADHQPRIPTGFCCVGSSTVRGRAEVRARRIAGGRRARVGCEQRRRQSLAPGVGGRGAARAQGGGARRAQAASRGRRAGASRAGVVGGPREARIRYRPVDVAARGQGHQTGDGSRPPSRPRLARVAQARLVAPASGAPRARARRGGHRGVEGHPVAAAKKTPGVAAPGSSSKTRAASRSNRSSAGRGHRAATRRS